MRLALFLVVAVFLLGCVQQGEEPTARTLKSTTAEPAITTTSSTAAVASTPTITPLPAPAPTPAQKIDTKGFTYILSEFLTKPGWSSSCKLDCTSLKELIGDMLCSISTTPPDEGGGFLHPFFEPLGFSGKDLKSSEKINEFWQKCRALSPEASFDCKAFTSKKPSCLSGQKDCRKFAINLHFDREKISKETGYGIEEDVLVELPLKGSLVREGCEENSGEPA